MATLYFLGSVGFVILSSFIAAKAIKKGTSSKKAIFSQMFSSFGFTAVLFAILQVCVRATDGASAEAIRAASNSVGHGLGLIGIGLVMGLTALGTGIAVASAAPAAIAATSEDPKAFGKAIVFVAMGEGILIFGFFLAFMMLLLKV